MSSRNLSDDPDDHNPTPPGAPPAKADLAAVMLEVCRRTLDEAAERATTERANRRTKCPIPIPTKT
jgi:hypothetical protein